MLGKIAESLRSPSQTMTWGQLAAAVVFVIVIAIAWRQVTLMIAGEL